MKKIISAAVVIMIALTMLVSCSSGVSVPYYILAMDNYTENVLDVYDGYKETITYYKNGEKDFEYSVYVDKGSMKSEDGYVKNYYYDVCESFEGYTFYAHNGELYSVTGGKTYAIIQADKSTYIKYVESYGERTHMLDAGKKYQDYSKTLDSGTEVQYYSKVTPLIAADLYHFGIKETDRIFSKYVLMENTDFYMSVEYTVEHSDGKREKIAERKFEYYKTKAENEHLFTNLPTLEETVNVYVIHQNGVRDTYIVPKGVYVGIDSGAENVSYFMDEALTIPFEADKTQALEDVKIYEKNN